MARRLGPPLMLRFVELGSFIPSLYYGFDAELRKLYWSMVSSRSRQVLGPSHLMADGGLDHNHCRRNARGGHAAQVQITGVAAISSIHVCRHGPECSDTCRAWSAVVRAGTAREADGSLLGRHPRHPLHSRRGYIRGEFCSTFVVIES